MGTRWKELTARRNGGGRKGGPGGGGTDGITYSGFINYAREMGNSGKCQSLLVTNCPRQVEMPRPLPPELHRIIPNGRGVPRRIPAQAETGFPESGVEFRESSVGKISNPVFICSGPASFPVN